MSRRIENRIEVPGTPEQVWEAIATGPGIEAWFVPAEVHDGRVRLDMGDGMQDAGPVTAFEPPHRFAYEEEWEGDPPGRLATEFLIEAKSGGTCVVRLVSTLYADGGDWDDALDQMHRGWDTFLLNLRAYLRDFPGERCTTVHETTEGDWDDFLATLDLDPAADHVSTPRFAGTIEYRGEREVQIRLTDPAPGLALVYAYDWNEKTKLVLHLYLFEGAMAVRSPG